MKRKNLLQTNPYLKRSDLEKMVYLSMASSTAIEGVHIKNTSQALSNQKAKKS